MNRLTSCKAGLIIILSWTKGSARAANQQIWLAQPEKAPQGLIVPEGMGVADLHAALEIRPKTLQLENSPANRISLGQGRRN